MTATQALSLFRKKHVIPPTPATTPQVLKLFEVIETQVAALQRLNRVILDLHNDCAAYKEQNRDVIKQLTMTKMQLNTMTEENERLRQLTQFF